MSRAGRSTVRLVVSADAVNASESLPTVHVMHVLDTDPESLLAVRIGDLGWASALQIDRPIRGRLPAPATCPRPVAPTWPAV